MNTTTTKPQDFGVMDCNDGITIEKAGKRYEVYKDGKFCAATDTLTGAMAWVEMVRKG
jgi:hypothetical protein